MITPLFFLFDFFFLSLHSTARTLKMDRHGSIIVIILAYFDKASIRQTLKNNRSVVLNKLSKMYFN